MLPPLITLDVSVEDEKATGLYDPCANITICSYEYFKKLRKKLYIPKSLTYRTMTGEGKLMGTIYAKVKIFDLEKKIRMFVVDSNKNFKHDLLIGLDSIIKFQLCQDHKCRITQAKENVERNKNEEESVESTNKEIEVNWNEFIPVEQFEMKTGHLDGKKKKIIFDLVDRYGSAFAKSQYDVGTVREKDYEASIELMENRYVAKRPYRCSIEDQKEIEKQVAELLKHGMIQESCSPFAAPVTLAYKKTGEGNKKEKNRMCIDF